MGCTTTGVWHHRHCRGGVPVVVFSVVVAAKTHVAEWLIERDSYLLLQDNAPWWLLTHYPEANDVFTWLDGLGVLVYIGFMALLLGGWITAWLRLAGALLPGGARQNGRWLAYALIPLGGVGVFLGLSSLTVTLLKAEGIVLPWLPEARGVLLGLATLWSIGLAMRMLAARRDASPAAKVLAQLCLLVAVAGILVPWIFLFYVW